MILFRLIRESFEFAVHALLNNRLRTILSLLGVTIGIFSIIFVLSVVDSLENEMKASFDTIGSDVMFIQKWPMGPEDGAEEYEWWKYMSRRPPSQKDMLKLQERLPEAAAMAFEGSLQTSAAYGNNYLSSAQLTGVSFAYDQTITLHIEQGRYFTEVECEAGNNYAIIGKLVEEKLFGGVSAIGKEMKVGGLKVIIIGVFAKEGTSLFGDGFDSVVLTPYAFATRLIPPSNEDCKILIKSKPGISNTQLRDELIATFRSVRGIQPRNEKDFSIIESSMINEIVDSIISVFNLVGIVIGIFSILVGAFSIANIMFVSVAERTNIIGIQKALGAKNGFILGQFLFESIALSAIGGAIGLLLVWGVVNLLGTFIDFEFILPMKRVFMGLLISVVVGVVAGIIPALKAARLNPVDAMRSK
ncbi:MAG: ABC transporter permease [Flavobacteriales bacterium]